MANKNEIAKAIDLIRKRRKEKKKRRKKKKRRLYPKHKLKQVVAQAFASTYIMSNYAMQKTIHEETSRRIEKIEKCCHKCGDDDDKPSEEVLKQNKKIRYLEETVHNLQINQEREKQQIYELAMLKENHKHREQIHVSTFPENVAQGIEQKSRDLDTL